MNCQRAWAREKQPFMKFKTPHVIKIPEVGHGPKRCTVLQESLSSNTHFTCDKGQEITPRGQLGQEPNWGMRQTSGWRLYTICQQRFRMALEQGCFLSSALPLSKWECPLESSCHCFTLDFWVWVYGKVCLFQFIHLQIKKSLIYSWWRHH